MPGPQAKCDLQGNSSWSWGTLPGLPPFGAAIELSRRLRGFWGKSQRTHSMRSQSGQSRVYVCSWYFTIGLKLRTPRQDHLEERGCLEQGWGLVHSGSANYSEFTGICLPERQRTEDTYITAAFWPRLGLSNNQGRQYQTGALMEQRP